MQKRKVNPPNNPACTILSKCHILLNQPTLGISLPGIRVRMPTTKNQAMPGKNFLKEILCCSILHAETMKPASGKLLHPLVYSHLPGYPLSALLSTHLHKDLYLLFQARFPTEDLLL